MAQRWVEADEAPEPDSEWTARRERVLFKLTDLVAALDRIEGVRE